MNNLGFLNFLFLKFFFFSSPWAVSLVVCRTLAAARVAVADCSVVFSTAPAVVPNGAQRLPGGHRLRWHRRFMEVPWGANARPVAGTAASRRWTRSAVNWKGPRRVRDGGAGNLLIYSEIHWNTTAYNLRHIKSETPPPNFDVFRCPDSGK